MAFREQLRRGQYALRILRYANPTQFTLVSCLLCSWGVMLASFFSGRSLVIASVMFLMFLPGLLRRNVFFKLRRRLEAVGAIKRVLDHLIVDENPNLDETNTQTVLSFVTDAETKPTAPRVITSTTE